MPIISFTRRIVAAGILFVAATQPMLGETFAQRVAPCLACHGENGDSPHPVVPSLGGQPAPYLLIQLYLFRENQRASTYKKGDEMVEIMSEMTKGFTDDAASPASNGSRSHAGWPRADYATSLQ
jgi:cytochrome c553